MEPTLPITSEQMQALKTAFPDLTPDEAALALLRAELERRCRLQLKRGVLVRLQSLKRGQA